MFARVVDGAIVETASSIPSIWTDPDGTVHVWSGRPPWATQPADYGWREVLSTNKPDDTATTKWEEGLVPELVDGVPVLPWIERPKTPEELALAQAAENLAQTGSKLQTIDFPAMQAILAQTNADINASPASEIKDLARAVRRLTRKVENLTDGSD